MRYSKEEWDMAIKETKSHIGERTMKGLVSSLRYQFLRCTVEVSEGYTDYAQVLQDRRKALDQVQMKMMDNAREFGADTDSLRLLFCYQWEDFTSLHQNSSPKS